MNYGTSDDSFNIEVEQWNDLYLIQRKPQSVYHWLLKYILHFQGQSLKEAVTYKIFKKLRGEVLVPGPSSSNNGQAVEHWGMVGSGGGEPHGLIKKGKIKRFKELTLK